MMKLTKQATLPRLDLPENRITGLEFSCVIDDDESVQSLLSYPDLADEGEIVSISGYTKSQIPHLIVATLGEMMEEESLVFGVRYSLDVDPALASMQPPRGMSREGELFRRLGKLSPAYPFDCLVSFYYLEDDERFFTNWLQIPPGLQPTAPGTTSPVSEITGIRATKYTNDDVEDLDAFEYAVSVDRPLLGGVTLTIEFPVKSTFTSGLAMTVRDRSLEILQSLNFEGSAVPR